jgi:3-dehydroquinate synthase
MKTVTVTTHDKSYNVLIGGNLLKRTGEFLSEIVPACTVTLITDDNVDKLYADTVIQSVQAHGYNVHKFVFTHGENSKSIETYQNILEFMTEKQMSRSDIIIALGGGVVGDIAGFAAATYLRGIKFISIATTLLAAVDSSVGGKTAVNLDAGKNQIGTFHQPSLVICDTDTLSTLSDKIRSDGYAEIIKYGMICDIELLNLENIDEIIERCVIIKSKFVNEDERDTGVRQLLNFGHTIGHAIEKMHNYHISHGHAVAYGMLIMTRAAVAHGLCGIDCLIFLHDKLKEYGLPDEIIYTYNSYTSAVMSDKKRTGDTLTIVIPTALGKCELYKIKVSEFSDFVHSQNLVAIKPHKLHGDINAVRSKSDIHREMFCRFLAGDTSYEPPYVNEDIRATNECVSSLILNHNNFNCGESGTTLRFILPVASALGIDYTAHVYGTLPQRPINELLDLMREHGCEIACYENIICVSGQLTSGTYKITGSVSSQYISGLLLALPLLSGDSRIELTSQLQSAAYVDMTIQKLSLFGVEITRTDYGYFIKGGQKYVSHSDNIIERDWSSGAVWLAAGVECYGLDMNSLQPDKEIVNIINNKHLDIDMSQCPDIVPVTAILASTREGTSILRNLGRLRYKESDRLQAIADNLTILGADIKIDGDSLVIKGVPKLTGGMVQGYNDHRIVMAMALASTFCDSNVIITDANTIYKSYPKFFDDFNKLGGEAYVL